MDENVVECVFCHKSSGSVIMFLEQTLKKCKDILKLRQKYKLKYKDVVLPGEEMEGGYHRECYKTFTALMKIYNENSDVTPKASTDRSTSSLPSTSHITPRSAEQEASTSMAREVHDNVSDLNSTLEENLTEHDETVENNPKICVFCNLKRKKHRSKVQPLHESDTESLKSSIIDSVKDREEHKDLYQRLINYHAPKIYYHTVCRVDFNNKIKLSTKQTVESSWHERRHCHQRAFERIRQYIQENVIEKGRCFFLNALHRQYIELLETDPEGNTEKINSTFTSQHLQDKITLHFQNDIKFITTHNKKLIAPKYLSVIDEQSYEHLQDEDILERAALLLRKKVLSTKLNKLPEKISTQDLIKGETTSPEKWLDFYHVLLNGCSSRKNSTKRLRIAQSFNEDVI